MPTETLHFENARVAQQLFNNDPAICRALEDELGVKATSREGWIKLEGAADGVERAKQLFQFLENSLKGGTAIRNREFTYAAECREERGRRRTAKTCMANASILRRAKPTSPPKPSARRNTSKPSAQHDVTFGIGPAGTGKTYLAMAMAVAALREEKVSRIILTRPAVEAGEALGLSAGRSLRENRALSPPPPRCAPRHDARRGNSETYGTRRRSKSRRSPTCAGARSTTPSSSWTKRKTRTTEQMFMFLTRLGISSEGGRHRATRRKSICRHTSTPAWSKRSACFATNRRHRHGRDLHKRDVVRHPLGATHHCRLRRASQPAQTA